MICESFLRECCRLFAIIVQIKWKQMSSPETSLQTLIPALVKAVPVKEWKCFKFLLFSVRWKLLTEKTSIDNLGLCPAAWGCKESRCSPLHSSSYCAVQKNSWTPIQQVCLSMGHTLTCISRTLFELKICIFLNVFLNPDSTKTTNTSVHLLS